MADKYLDELDAITTLTDDDLLHVENAPSGTPEDVKITWADFKTNVKTYGDTLYTPYTGWVEVSDSWSYASSTTITVPSDATTLYQVGDRIRLKQGSGYKYYVVTAVAATLLTVYGGSDYTVANATITNIAYSRVIRPYGYPDVFNFTPSWTNLTVGNATVVAKVAVHGRVVKGNVSVKWAAAGVTTSIGGAVSLTPPIAILSTLSAYTTVGAAALIDWASALYMGECVMVGGNFELRCINTAGTYAVWATISSTVPFTWGADDLFTMEFSYLI